ncbi:hypothetical protein SAMN04488587_0217 [Methanococcoides vulcani]|uniref:Uncharacterized protein n=1 Tax=Methanococcoides vulcani TaxID=1353158 RepID=A0A1H9Y3R6_9EURY|nr:hypothetical protein SAMN04488587_0217 [Methanococcoides vulcani]
MDREPISRPEFDGLIESGFPNNDVIFFTERNWQTRFRSSFFAHNKYQQCLTDGLYKCKRDFLKIINIIHIQKAFHKT